MIETQIRHITEQCQNHQTLVAVTKTVPVEQMERARSAGITIFGENRVQELLSKYDYFIDTEIQWHLIGNLQTNKVKYIIDKVTMIQSLNRQNLAIEIQKQAQKLGISMDCLVEVNIGNEANKHGLAYEDVEDFLAYLANNCPNIRVCGLMAMAPYVKKEQTRPYFAKMYRLFYHCQQFSTVTDAFQVLSMGMSHDWQVAVEEGSTMIRIGSAIFSGE